MPWTAGQRLQGGKYVIGEVLGQGGFGITYKALHVELNRTVVIKTPNEYLKHDPEYDKYIERFIKEGQTLARLSQDPHPHIVGVIDLFQESSTHCLVMDFVPGENLFQAVRRRGALPEAEIVPCIRQIGEALMVVHQAGLVHRDAHPGNIMLRNNGKAVLIDFGIAKELLPKTLTSKGIAANEAFAPYEQKSRGSREPTVDVYCLAATLYYAVTGEFPQPSMDRKFSKNDHNIDPLISPKEIISGISDRLNQAILKGMALEAKDRPQSMQAWLAMLEEPKPVPPPTVEPDYKRETVYSKAKPKLEAIPGKSATRLPRIIPWSWLVGVLLISLLIGYSLAAINALYVTWAWAWAVALVWAGAGAWAWAVALVLVVVLLVAVAVASAGVPAVVLVVCWAVAVTVAVTVAGEELQESFSKFHTFLILAGTSSLGLGLGWLGHRIFPTGS